MILTEYKAIEILKNPQNVGFISSVKMQESQLRVFTEALEEDEVKQEPYYSKLLESIKKGSSKKFDRICDFFRYPLPIVEDSDAILNDFFKVFDGKNRYFSVNGNTDTSLLEDWIKEYNLEKWIEENIKDVWVKKPNSFVVVDVNKEGVYLLNIDSKRLIDAKFKNKHGQLDYIAFIHSVEKLENSDIVQTRYSVYDDENYYVFYKNSNSDSYILLSHEKHSIGYCPGHSFIKDSVTDRNLFKRSVAFSKSLARLEDYTKFDVYNNYLDHYAPFPVTEAPFNPCQNQDCVDGKVSEQIVLDVRTGKTKQVYNDCSVCNGGKDEGKFIMPGTHLGIKVSHQQGKDGSGVFKMHFPETDKLKYVPEKLDKLLLHIKNSVVGVNGMMSKEAVNELQAKGGFEAMEAVILRNKRVLEYIYKWTAETVGRVLYKNPSLVIEANYGTKWYLSSEEELQERYNKAKDYGLPPEEVINIYKELINTKYQGNNYKVQRELMLVDLDPFPIYSVDDCIKMKKESVLDDFQLSLKVNFFKFISKFEDENTDITRFGINLEYSKRLAIIEKTIYLYNTNLIELKNVRNNPNKDDDKGEVITQEQLEAQSRLKGTVGGVEGVLKIQESVSFGTTSRDSAITTLIEFYGISEEKAKSLLGSVGSETNNNINKQQE